MASLSSLSIANSGMYTAKAGLYVIGHNMSNTATDGYVRQRVLQNDFLYNNKGYTPNGKLLVGLGADVTSINQIRDKFIDIAYREEVSKGSFYGAKAMTGSEIEVILGELQSSYKAQTVITDMWDSLNEISVYEPGLETRANFIATCHTFVNKVNNMSDRLFEYQHNIDNQIRDSVMRVNQLLLKIAEYNGRIAEAEVSKDNANDFRDVRNLALDELSTYIDITYKERPSGMVDILMEGRDLLMNNHVNKLGLKYTTGDYDLVEPVFTSSDKILPFDEPKINYQTLYDLTGKVDSINDNDKGKIKGLMVSRGYMPVNYATQASINSPNPLDAIYGGLGVDSPLYNEHLLQYQKDLFNVDECFIPRVQKELDTIVNKIVTLINDSVAPKDHDASKAPYGLDGSQFTEIFVRKTKPRYDGTNAYIPENPDDYYSLYSIGNIMVNPKLLDTDGYNKLAFSLSKDVEDNRLVLDIMEKWKNPIVSINGSEPLTIDDGYKQFANDISTTTREAISFNNEQTTLVTQITNKRQELSGVSLDEEMSSMLTYQHAFNAAARVANYIDSMLDKLINGTGVTR